MNTTQKMQRKNSHHHNISFVAKIENQTNKCDPVFSKLQNKVRTFLNFPTLKLHVSTQVIFREIHQKSRDLIMKGRKDVQW